MTRITISSDVDNARVFLVRVEGTLERRKALHDALGRRLARELQGHFRGRNAEPNKLGGKKTNFWEKVAAATMLAEVTETGAVVAVAERRFRIHVLGGTILPTNGRKALTIPLVPEARGARVSEYEARSGHKLFRLPGTALLFERGAQGTETTPAALDARIRRKDGTPGRVKVRARSLIRPVYALVKQAVIKPDARALPPAARLVAALQAEADGWLQREMSKNIKGGKLA